MRRIGTNKPSIGGGAARSPLAKSPILMGDLTLRWIVTILFTASIATYAYILVAQHDRWTSTVNHLLHLTMAAAMIMMAWGLGMNLPTVGPMIFFLLVGAWFVRVAGRVSAPARDRLTNSYYAVTVAAMAWMYAVMNSSLPGSDHPRDHAVPASLAMNTSGTDTNMSGIHMSAHDMSRTLPDPGWITTVNWIATLGFAVMALYWTCRSFARRRRTHPAPHTAHLARVEPLYQVFTAAGTALMFGALL